MDRVSISPAGYEHQLGLGNLPSSKTKLLFAIIEKLSTTSDLAILRKEISEDLLCLLRSDVLASYIWNEDSHVFGDFAGLNQDPLNVSRYLSYYQFHDPITSTLQKRKRATRVSEIMSQKELEKTEFFNDFLMKDGQHHGMNLHVYDGKVDIGDFRVWRNKGKPDFTEQEAALLDSIIPYFRNALLNARAISKAEGMEAFWRQLLDNIDVALFLFDENCRLVYQNREARLVESELRHHQGSSFTNHLRSALRDDQLPSAWGPFCLSFMRTNSPQDSRPLTAVLAHRSQRKVVGPELLQEKFGLSQRETEVAILVFKGLTDREIAAALGIAFSTLRTHLKHLFAKLDATTRTEMIYRLFEEFVDVAF